MGIRDSSRSNLSIHTSDEDAQIMRWLSPLEPNTRHQAVRADRFEGVGEWVLETGGFREWRGSDGEVDKAVLFCLGNPGVGKTYLSSLVIDSLHDQAKGEDIGVAGLYYDFFAQREQTTTNVLGAILGQLVGRGGIPEDLRKAFHKGKGEIDGRGPRLADVMRMLRIAIASLRQVFICIDALDECLPKHLTELLKSLRDVVRESPTTRIFFTGRPHIKEDIQRYFTTATVIPIFPNADDVRNYVEMRLNRDTKPDAMNNDLRADIVRVALVRTSHIFLLVLLSIDAILGEVTIRQRRERLEEVAQGNGLSDAYTTTLTRLKAQTRYKSMLGLKVLMWVLHSERPLRAEELCHALGVEMGSADLDPENVPALRPLLASCFGLVTVEAFSSTVRLVHFTLQEYLSNDPMLFYSPHSAIAEACLTYLNFGCVRELSPTLDSAPPTMPLLEYASYYWGEHTRWGMTENVKSLALRLLDRFDEHISAQLLLLRYNQTRSSGPYFFSAGGPIGFTGLHGVAFLGIAEIAAAVLEMKERDVNAADCMGSTALTWAAGRGQEEVVKMLLERKDINPDQVGTQDGQTPLPWAAERGHEEIVKMLLERRDVNPDQADAEYGRTPLSWAGGSGHEGIVKMLLERKDVNPNQADIRYGRTPLSWAAERGYEGVAKMLLERRDVNPDQADIRYGRTPLSWADGSGHEGIVKMLLERNDVNPNPADIRYGRTPFEWAAMRGHEGAVKMLLEREEFNLGQADIRYGRTPLSLAAEYGHEDVVRMHLEREDVNPNMADTDGGTPLSWAAWGGHQGIVKVPLKRKDVRTAMPDNKNQTPLSLALSKGHGGVARVLLERSNIEKSVTEKPKTNPTLKAEQVSKKLKDAIINRRKGLQKMYGETELELDKSLKVPIKRGEEMAKELITMGCNIEVAKNLTLLTIYDVAILIDDSDSMIREENGKRRKTLIQFIDHITEIYSMANESGILAMRFMNRGGGKNNWTGKSQEYLDHHSYGGVLRIGTELRKKILDRFAIGNDNQSKPLLVLIVTSGAVEGEKRGHLKNVIRDCVKEREGASKGRDAVKFQFSCIGNDPGAARLLRDLDQDPDIGEYINVFRVPSDLDHQLANKWLVLQGTLLGAISPLWGNQTEDNSEIEDRLADTERDVEQIDFRDNRTDNE